MPFDFFKLNQKKAPKVSNLQSQKTEKQSEGEPVGLFPSGIGFQTNIRPISNYAEGLVLTKKTCELLEDVCVNDPVISTCFERTLDACDTEFEIELESTKGKLSKLKGKKLLEMFQSEIPRAFFNTYTLREVRRFILTRLIQYGAFHASLVIDEFGKMQAIIPPAYSIGYDFDREKQRWIPVQGMPVSMGGLINKRRVLEDGFINKMLTIIQTEQGIFWIPPMKAALRLLATSEIFWESFGNVLQKFGMQQNYIAEVNTGTHPAFDSEFAKKQSIEQKVVDHIATQINNQLGTALITVPKDMVTMKPLSTFASPETLVTAWQLINEQIVVGAKLFLSWIGTQGQANQTTLSNNQKQALKQYFTSIQAAADSAFKQILEYFLFRQGIVGLQVRIEAEEPQLEDELTNEQAKKQRLENEKLEKELESNGETKLDDQNNMKANKGETPAPEGESQEVEIESEDSSQ